MKKPEESIQPAEVQPAHNNVTCEFQEIPVGGHFEYGGRRYQKVALSMASDEDRNGNIFMRETRVQRHLVAEGF